MASFAPPPGFAAWRHREAREGFEVVFLRESGCGYRLEGETAAVEEGAAWTVSYAIEVDREWQTLRAEVSGRSLSGERELRLEADGRGRWKLDGKRAAELDGCLDVDLESSSFTNALPVHRLGLEVGRRAEAPAAYVRASDLSVERLQQSYVRAEDDGPHQRFEYAAPRFDFRCVLVYDEAGLVLDYPGIASRAA